MKIFLIGYMASGKTTFGKALAKEAGMNFIDLDDYIIEKTGMPITEIFALHGEKYFRDLERKLLREVAENDNTIIACGGGTPCFFDNLDYMNSKGKTVWMKASEDVLLNRLLLDSDNRPLVKGKNKDDLLFTIRTQLEQRLPYYSHAEVIWNADLLEDESQIKDSVKSFLKK